MHALRYYERPGLAVTPTDRTDSGRRRYRQLDLDWIIICAQLRTTGMPIRTIRRYAELVSAGPGNERERLALLELHRAGVTARLEQITENLRLIDHKIDVYRGSLRPATQISCGHRARLRSEDAAIWTTRPGRGAYNGWSERLSGGRGLSRAYEQLPLIGQAAQKWSSTAN